MTDWDELLARVAAATAAFRRDVRRRAVREDATLEELRATFGGPVPESGEDAFAVVDRLIAEGPAGVVATVGPRYFGFVVGGSTPASLAADWLASGWDGDAGLYVLTPAAAVMEETAGRWVVDLLGLPAEASVGFVTGGMMANFSGLAAGRNRVLAGAGWDVEAHGLQGAPRVRVVVGAECHVTIHMALRYLGLGARNVTVVDADDQGRMRAGALAEALAGAEPGPTIVCTQAGNVNTGAFDPFDEICTVAHEHGAWVHVDGAFGLWAAVSPAHRHLVRGVEHADSWATDGHKWLNVPYDCGIVVVRDREAHRSALASQASYLVQGGEGAPYDPFEWVPEFSRRARGVPVYAAVRELGRTGVRELVERCCALARRFADRLAREDGIEVLNDVVLNQVLVRFGDSDETTRAVIDGVQRDGTCWMGGTVWNGRAAMRISVSNATTTEADVDASADAVVRVFRGG